MNGKYKGTRDRDRKQARPRSRRYEFAPARGRAKHRRRVRIVWRRFLPVMGCAFLLIFGSVKLFGYLASSRQVKETEAELQALYEAQKAEPTVTTPTPASTTTPTADPTATPAPQILPAYQQINAAIAPAMRELYGRNSDLVGWVEIPGVVSAPVVYRDNSYYLTHDFYGRESTAGALFLDVNHPLAENTQNLLIYGHNMHDGTMFGHFRRYQRTAYWQENCLVRLSTLYTQEIYVIFAVMTVSTDPASPQYVNFAGHPTFRTVREFDAYMEEVQAHTLYPWKVDVNASDALLTLATCLDEERVVLLARRLREGESVEDVAAIMAA